jgi:hypothetical protein
MFYVIEWIFHLFLQIFKRTKNALKKSSVGAPCFSLFEKIKKIEWSVYAKKTGTLAELSFGNEKGNKT